MNKLSSSVFQHVCLYLCPSDIIYIEQLSTYYRDLNWNYYWWTQCHRAKIIQPILCDKVVYSWKLVYKRLKSYGIKMDPASPINLQKWFRWFPAKDEGYQCVLLTLSFELDRLNVDDVERRQDAWTCAVELSDHLTFAIDVYRQNTHFHYPLETSSEIIMTYGLILSDHIETDGIEGILKVFYLLPDGEVRQECDYAYRLYLNDGNADSTISECLPSLIEKGMVVDYADGRISINEITCLVCYTEHSFRRQWDIIE